MDYNKYEKQFEIFEMYCDLKERKKYLDYGHHPYQTAEHMNNLRESYKQDMIKFLKRIENHEL